MMSKVLTTLYDITERQRAEFNGWLNAVIERNVITNEVSIPREEWIDLTSSIGYNKVKMFSAGILLGVAATVIVRKKR